MVVGGVCGIVNMNLCAILMIGRRGEVERMGDKIMFCQRDVFISHFNGACDVVIVHTKLKPHANQKKMYEMYSYCLIFLSSQFTIPLICCCLRFFGCTKKIYFKSWCWIVTKWKHCANTLAANNSANATLQCSNTLVQCTLQCVTTTMQVQ